MVSKNGPVVIAEVFLGMYRLEGQECWTWSGAKSVTGVYRGHVINIMNGKVYR